MEHSVAGGTTPHYIITFDGGSKGNPGAGYGSYELRTRDNRARIERKEYPGKVTNNEAEYRTLIAGLEDLSATLRKAGKDPKAYQVEVRGDSQLVIQQLLGKYKVRHPNMLPLYEQARALAAGFAGVSWVWHARGNSVTVLGH
jgi:ribonuclease HI